MFDCCQNRSACAAGGDPPVEVFGASDGHEAVGVGEFGEAADLVVLLEGGSDSHDEEEDEGERSAPGETKPFFS